MKLRGNKYSLVSSFYFLFVHLVIPRFNYGGYDTCLVVAMTWGMLHRETVVRLPPQFWKPDYPNFWHLIGMKQEMNSRCQIGTSFLRHFKFPDRDSMSSVNCSK